MKSRTLLTLLVLVLGTSGSSAELDQGPPAAGAAMPVGRWSVAFANGVTQICEIGEDGSASVVEPLRTSGGTAAIRNGAFVIASEDDRVERWTPVGQRMVVEHWYPASQFPCGTPVLGIAERAQNSVVEVSLEGPQVNDASLVHLKALTNLESLTLSRSQVTDAGLEHLKGLTGLRVLDLYETTVGDAGLEHLKGLARLELLILKRTNVTEAGAAKLQQSLPNCLISHSPRN